MRVRGGWWEGGGFPQCGTTWGKLVHLQSHTSGRRKPLRTALEEIRVEMADAKCNAEEKYLSGAGRCCHRCPAGQSERPRRDCAEAASPHALRWPVFFTLGRKFRASRLRRRRRDSLRRMRTRTLHSHQESPDSMPRVQVVQCQ